MTVKPSLSFRVIIAEDDEISRMALQLSLEQEGFQVRSAGKVAEALELAQNFSPHVLLTDIGLPDGSGILLFKKLHDLYHTEGIAITGYDSEEAIASYKAAGFKRWVIKPVDFDVLGKLALEVVGGLQSS